jgi:hypothetical protein
MILNGFSPRLIRLRRTLVRTSNPTPKEKKTAARNLKITDWRV